LSTEKNVDLWIVTVRTIHQRFFLSNGTSTNSHTQFWRRLAPNVFSRSAHRPVSLGGQGMMAPDAYSTSNFIITPVLPPQHQLQRTRNSAHNVRLPKPEVLRSGVFPNSEPLFDAPIPPSLFWVLPKGKLELLLPRRPPPVLLVAPRRPPPDLFCALLPKRLLPPALLLPERLRRPPPPKAEPEVKTKRKSKILTR